MQVYAKILGKAGTERIAITDPRLTGIIFILDDGQEFHVKEGESGLRVSAANGRLVIEPEASNVIQVSELRE